MGSLPRIHTYWAQTNTATGRLASLNPNMQNLPKQPMNLTLGQEEKKIVVRDAFCAKDGCVLVSFDYSQIEMRILAHMSHDPYLLQFFNEEQDIHRLIAGRWLGKKPEEVSSEERERAKRIVYGILYGMGAPSLAAILEVTLGEAATFIDTFLGKFPGVALFLEQTIKAAKEKKFIKTLFGRRRIFPDIHSKNKSLERRSERQAVNSVIQGTAADVVKLAMIEIDAIFDKDPKCKDAKLLLQIHDELVFEIPESSVDVICPIINSTMESVIQLEVAMPVRMNLGKRWGSMEPPESKSDKQVESQEDEDEAEDIDALMHVADE
eukprot:TRINITY_DN6268_c0_g1_i1.p1 TRINITY_DN6268_c0_g1~~TRINITY_DN6268_c0_g1_i1.p1  ORF type:complete len:322 (-),score=139.70 TRINITY_DN6268_c0_g1_i1:39-1004(-)